MRFGSFYRFRQCFWGVVVAILLGALAPVVSQILSARGASQWQEICTTAGMIRIAVDGEGDPQPVSAFFHYCPYCVSHAGDDYLPPVDDGWWRLPLVVKALAWFWPAFDYRPDKFPFAASLLFSRAPPALS